MQVSTIVFRVYWETAPTNSNGCQRSTYVNVATSDPRSSNVNIKYKTLASTQDAYERATPHFSSPNLRALNPSLTRLSPYNMAAAAVHLTTDIPHPQLLTFQLSPEQFTQQVVRVRKPDHPPHATIRPDQDASKKQAIVVRGCNADAVAAIKAVARGEQDVLKAEYVAGSDLVRISIFGLACNELIESK